MKITIIKSKTRKRSIQISVNKDREVTVKAPFKTSDKQIEKFLQEHKQWIEKTLIKIPLLPQKTYTEGETFMLLGKEYPLYINRGSTSFEVHPHFVPRVKHNKPYIVFTNNECVLVCSKIESTQIIKKGFIKFYKSFGKEYSLTKSKEYADLINKSFNRISIKDVSTRWGSCSTKNNLNYNFRLFMAPKEVVDYVIAHEVAHLKFRNHKKEFWDLVEQIYPNYKVYRKWLKKNGHLLTL